jgi:hypothetical protein
VLGFSIEGNFLAEKEMYLSEHVSTLLEELDAILKGE